MGFACEAGCFEDRFKQLLAATLTYLPWLPQLLVAGSVWPPRRVFGATVQR